MEGLSGRLAFASPPDDGRRDVPGGVRLARSAPGRRARRQLPVGRHGVPWAAFHLWRLDGRRLRRTRPGGPARLPGGLDRTAFSSGAHGHRGRRPGRLDQEPSHACRRRRRRRRSELAAWSSRRVRGQHGSGGRRLARVGRSDRQAARSGRSAGRDHLPRRQRRGRGGRARHSRRGGMCETLAYDAGQPAEAQLAGARPRADARLLLRHSDDLPSAIGAVCACAAGRVPGRLRGWISAPGAGAAGAAQRRVAVLSVIGVCRGAAARHARIRHGQGRRRDALQRNEPGVGAAARHRRSAAAPADRSDRVGHRDHAALSGDLPAAGRAEVQSWPRPAASGTAPADPLQTASAG